MNPSALLNDWDYPPIGDYAVIGNCRTIALVSRQGSIDWLCLPHFSSPSLFAALLDRHRGGRFAIRPRDVQRTQRSYRAHTPVLQTEVECNGGTVRLTDFFTVLPDDVQRDALHPQHQLVRIVECVSGEVSVDVLVQPRPDYARHIATLIKRGKLGWLCQYRGLVAYLQSTFQLDTLGPGSLAACLRLRASERHQLVLNYCENDVGVLCPLGGTVDQWRDYTVRWWQSWCDQCSYRGDHREAVLRSAITLKLLTYCLSGAVVAAPTTSLPEGPSGARNWDYRYCWLRDTSLVLQSFVDLGFVAEARAFLGWLLHATRLTQPRLQVLYDIYGETALTERELPHLEGYRGLKPVRIGNAAHNQLQLDVYGEVVLTAFGFVERGGTLDAYERDLLLGFARSVCKLWTCPDSSIWEVRTAPRHNTYSKLMCWVALDRLVQLEGRLRLSDSCEAMRTTRDRIRADIEANGFDPKLNSYVGYYGGQDPDASLLLLARYGYLHADDPRMVGTVRYIEQRLSVAGGLLYRYPPGGQYDGVRGPENLFAICSFWLVDYLARLGDVTRARNLFERLLGLANDVGLYAEEFSASDFAPLGNFPQAFSHVGLITAALSLDQAQRGKRDKEIAK
ncbi:MAG TPA: glycoside hydrolase family 15 protein [Burkholderiales bacterium]|nr:glycoside hydrolase family 15 protein [Burkholderiales bacterium]